MGSLSFASTAIVTGVASGVVAVSFCTTGPDAATLHEKVELAARPNGSVAVTVTG